MAPRARGFSIIELLVAVGILATCILLVVGIFTTLVAGSQKSDDKTAGFIIAESLMAQETYALLGDAATATTFFQTPYVTPTAILGGTYQVNNASYYYKIYAQDVQLSSSAGPFQLNSAQTDGSAGSTNLKRLDMVLWWWDARAGAASSVGAMSMNGSRPGYGSLQVHISRTLWPTGAY